MIATLDASGKVLEVAEATQSRKDDEIAMADSSARAIWKCSPYKGAGPGKVTFHMDADAMF